MHLRVKFDIKQTLKLDDESRKRFSKYSKMYIMTTENIDGYYKYFDFKDKKVLVPTSSFDHALNAILKGASEVDTFDINRLSFYISNLKLAAVKSLTYNEFINFFLSDNPFNYETYIKICQYLDNDIIDYFNTIYKHFNYNGKIIKDSFLFHHGHKNLIKDNTYLLNNNYDILKEKVKNTKIVFINTSLLKLRKKINKKYDLIFLSNISDYAKSFFKENYLEKYFNFIKNNISKLLNKGGIIQLAYIYDYGADGQVRSDINIEEKRKEVLTEEFEVKTIPSTIECLKNDAIITYKGGMSYGKQTMGRI